MLIVTLLCYSIALLVLIWCYREGIKLATRCHHCKVYNVGQCQWFKSTVLNYIVFQTDNRYLMSRNYIDIINLTDTTKTEKYKNI